MQFIFIFVPPRNCSRDVGTSCHFHLIMALRGLFTYGSIMAQANRRVH